MSADAVTGYVVMRLWAWKREGRQVKELLLKGGLNSTAGGYTIGGHAVTRTGPAVSTIVGWCRPTGFAEDPKQ